jgi:hypothetical protein
MFIKPDADDYDTTCPVCGNEKTFVGDFAGSGYFACDHCEDDPPASETDDIADKLIVVQAELIKRYEKKIEELETGINRHLERLEMIDVAIEDATGENAQLRGAIKDAIEIFDRDGGEGQSAWNMRAVLLQALNKAGGK